jgi:hypothetical protein
MTLSKAKPVTCKNKWCTANLMHFTAVTCEACLKEEERRIMVGLGLTEDNK